MAGGYHRNVLMPHRRPRLGGNGPGMAMGMGIGMMRRPSYGGMPRMSAFRGPLYIPQPPRRRRSRFGQNEGYDDNIMDYDYLDYWSDADDMIDEMDLYGDGYDSDYDSDDGDWL